MPNSKIPRDTPLPPDWLSGHRDRVTGLTGWPRAIVGLGLSGCLVLLCGYLVVTQRDDHNAQLEQMRIDRNAARDHGDKAVQVLRDEIREQGLTNARHLKDITAELRRANAQNFGIGPVRPPGTQ